MSEQQTCRVCRQEKSLSSFGLGGQRKYRMRICRVCRNAQQREYYRNNRDRIDAAVVARGKAIRLEALLEALVHYGKGGDAVCVCCGESEPAFLTLDHVDGGGNRARQTSRGYKLFRHLRRDGYPLGYQTLCFNCNWGKYALGRCPHTRKRGSHVD